MSGNAITQSDSEYGRRVGRGWRLPILALMGILAFGAWNFQTANCGPLWADDGDDATEESGPASRYTVALELDSAELSVVLADDGSVTLQTGEDYGSWSLPFDSDDFFIESGGSTWALSGMAQSTEGGSGVATWTSASGDTLEGTWIMVDIHPIDVGGMLYNLEFVDDYVLTGTFTTITVEGIVRDVSVGEGNTVEVISSLGNEVVHLADGCHVFIGTGDESPFGLAIQDPQGKGNRLEPRRPGQQQGPPPSFPRLYAAGVWKSVSEAANACFKGNPADAAAGRNCGAKGVGCALAVQLFAGGKFLERRHHGPCEDATHYYRENPNGTLFVSF